MICIQFPQKFLIVFVVILFCALNQLKKNYIIKYMRGKSLIYNNEVYGIDVSIMLIMLMMEPLQGYLSIGVIKSSFFFNANLIHDYNHNNEVY